MKNSLQARLGAILALCFSLFFQAACAERVTFIATGDICLANGVEQAMKRHGRDFPFAAMQPTLRDADILFGNLECVIATGGEKVNKQYNFRGSPRGALALKEAGFDIVSLANNHSLDYGREALGEMVRHLRKAGVAPVGGGLNLREARAMKIITRKGVKVGFLAYLGLFPPVVPLIKSEPGVAMADLPRIRQDVRAARKKVDFLIVSMHAGVERARKPSLRQQSIARAAIDAGADMVIGHHPHVVQPRETYKGRPIFYSLGNFVFDPSPAFLKEGGRGWSAMVVATIEKGQPVRATLVELRIVKRQPRPARGSGNPER